MEASNVASSDGQVCDRCRQKKIKCDGATPVCSNCATSDNVCEVSAKLRRRTKIRGYNANNSYVERLEAENAQLKAQLQSQLERSNALQGELARAHQGLLESNRPAKLRKIVNPGVLTDSPATVSGESDLSTHNRTAFVVKHMGRMVFDHTNVGRFAGSTTGVHFVASVEELCKQRDPTIRSFPEDCFRLHLTQLIDLPDNPTSLSLDIQTAKDLLSDSIEHYVKQIDIFNDAWLALCPVLLRTKFVREISHALNVLRFDNSIDNKTASTLQTMVAMLLINNLPFGKIYLKNDIRTQQLLVLSCQLHHLVIAQSDLESLQALILFSFFLQLSGQTNWLIQVNGLQVRLAQSMGMHRHARRFKFTHSETELRKRMWWWVYCFDKITSIVHGMPKLLTLTLSDVDVDNDLPIDCDLSDTDAEGLSHLLPGEPSPVILFIHYVQLGRILSTILSQLYTTSHRRGREQQIDSLDRDLRIWHQGFCSVLQISTYDVHNIDRITNRNRWQNHTEDECAIIANLDLLANFAMILIHRPALTFDSTTSRFKESLSVCKRSCTTIIQLVDSSPLHEAALHQVPFGSALIFQSALMQIFYDLNSEAVNTFNESNKDPDLLQKATQILRRAIISQTTAFSVTALIELLSTSSICTAGQSDIALNTPERAGIADQSIIFSYIDDPNEHDIWVTSSLESLNHLDVLYGSWGTGDFAAND